MAIVVVALSLVVVGLLTAAVLFAASLAMDRVATRQQARVVEEQLRALDATLAITRAQYDTERRLWAAALEESERGRR